MFDRPDVQEVTFTAIGRGTDSHILYKLLGFVAQMMTPVLLQA
jgi:hypothetical protein